MESDKLKLKRLRHRKRREERRRNGEDQEKRKNKLLKKLLESIISPQAFISKARMCTKNILAKLKSQLEYICRTKIAGSIGRKTEILYPDIFVLIFIHNTSQSLAAVMEGCVSVLLKYKDELTIAGDIKIVPYSSFLKFKLPTGNIIHLHFRPSKNKMFSGAPLLLATKNEGTDDISPSSKECDLRALQVDFLRAQNEFTQNCIRISKFWFTTLCFQGNKFPRIHRILEIVAIAAANDCKRKSYVEFLSNFFEKTSNVDKLQLLFPFPYKDESQHSLTEEELQYLQNNPETPSELKEYLSLNNFIVDPVDVSTNLASNLSHNKELTEVLKSFSRVSQLRLKPANVGSCNEFWKIFQPQPKGLLCGQFGISIQHFYVNFTSACNLSPSVGVYCRNSMDSNLLDWLVEAILAFLIMTAKLVPVECSSIKKKGIVRRFRRVIQTSLMNEKYNELQYQNYNKRSPDAVFRIPLEMNSSTAFIKLWFCIEF